MKQVSVIALRPFDWQGQSYVAGQSVQLSVIDAVALAKKHHITLTRKKVLPSAPVVAPEPVKEPEPPKRRAYKRRDLQPEETTVMEPHASTSEPQE